MMDINVLLSMFATKIYRRVILSTEAYEVASATT